MNDIRIYSRNSEEFRSQSLEEVLTDLQDDDLLKVGEVIYSCVPEPTSHSRFIDVEDIIDSMIESAHGEYGEYADDYLADISNQAKAELQKFLENWFDKNAASPTFYLCADVQEVVINQQMIDEFQDGIEDGSYDSTM